MAEALTVELKADIKSFATAMNQANQSLLKLVEGTKKTSQATQSMANTMKGLGAGLIAAFAQQGIQALNQLADQFVTLAEAPTKFKSSLEALTGSSKRAEDMLTRVYGIAKRTGTGFEDAAGLVQRLTIGLKDLGANNAQISQIAENILKLGTIGGSSIADTAGAALQLSQALASGKLQGDELRTIMERMPTLMQILAKEMGVSVGELKKLGSEGKITADVIANSLLKATGQINEDFKKMPLTVGQAMNNVKTSIQQAFDNPAARAGVQAIAVAVNQIAVAIGVADRAIRQFMTQLVNFGSDLANFFEPVTRTLTKLGEGFTTLANIVGPVMSTIKNIILAALVGPIVTVISNWDKLIAYFNNAIPAMFNNMLSVATSAMASLIRIFANAWDAIVGIAAKAVNAMIGLLNKFVGLFNQASALMGGGTLVEPFKEVTFEALRSENAIKSLSATSQAYATTASSYAQKYASDLRTIARSQAEQAALAQTGAVATNEYASALKALGTAADGGTGSGKGGSKSGGAAGAVKKVGDAAKTAAEQMQEAVDPMKEFADGLKNVVESMGSQLVDSFFAIAEGTKTAKEAFADMAKSMLQQIMQLIVQMLILKPLMASMGGFGGGIFGLLGGGGGGIYRSMSSFSAAPRIGGYGATGDYTGFNLRPSVTSSMMSSSQPQKQGDMKVTVNNNVAGASVQTRRNADGSIDIDLVMDELAARVQRGGNSLDKAFQGAFGVRRRGR